MRSVKRTAQFRRDFKRVKRGAHGSHRDKALLEECGVSGPVRFDPGASGLGLVLTVQPAWGHAASGVQRL